MAADQEVKTKTYYFEVRETSVREAAVEARNVTEARDLLNRWANGEDLADMGGDAPIQLADIESVKMTFRSLGARA